MSFDSTHTHLAYPVEPVYLKEVLHDQHIATISKMPFVWTSVDTRNAALASIIPASLGLAHYISAQPSGGMYQFLEGSVKPQWAQYSAPVFGALDAIAMTPLGYLSYLIYKNGGGFDYTDTSVALGLYGTNLLFVCASFPLYERRNHKAMAINKGLIFLTAVATAVAFYKIDEKAGLMYGVYAALTAGCATLYYQMFRMNSQKTLED